MTKTIKFNLILNENSVRNLEDLRNNFSIEDVLELFNNGLLKRWLKVRGYEEILKKVENVNFEKNIDVISQLIKIFEIELDEKKIKEEVSIFEHLKDRAFQLKEYERLNFKVSKIIHDYHSGYDAIVEDIIANKDDMAKIKANINEIEKNYLSIFNINYGNLYYYLIEEAPLSIFAILMNSKLRNYFTDTEYPYRNTLDIYVDIIERISNVVNLKEQLGEELKIFKGDTEAYWKDLEPSGERFMIINMQSGNFLRNSGKFGEELASTDINNRFIIVEGIDYKSNNANHELLYMEV